MAFKKTLLKKKNLMERKTPPFMENCIKISILQYLQFSQSNPNQNPFSDFIWRSEIIFSYLILEKAFDQMSCCRHQNRPELFLKPPNLQLRTMLILFIGPESDHWLCLSLTHSLTHWLPFSKLDWCDPGVWRWQLKTCWSYYCCWCWCWG